MNPIATPLLADLGSIEKIVVTVLAVSGGFLVGAIVTHLVIAGLAKFVLKKQSSEKLTRVLRFAGGVGAAILVYLLLSGDGGLGLGGKGGSEDLSRNEGKNKEQPIPKQDPKQQPKIDQQPNNGSKTEAVTVYVLHSDSPEQRFYRYETETQSLTISEVLKRIEGQVRMGRKPIVLIRAGDQEYAYQAATLLELKLREREIDASFLKMTGADMPKKN